MSSTTHTASSTSLIAPGGLASLRMLAKARGARREGGKTGERRMGVQALQHGVSPFPLFSMFNVHTPLSSLTLPRSLCNVRVLDCVSPTSQPFSPSPSPPVSPLHLSPPPSLPPAHYAMSASLMVSSAASASSRMGMAWRGQAGRRAGREGMRPPTHRQLRRVAAAGRAKAPRKCRGARSADYASCRRLPCF